MNKFQKKVDKVIASIEESNSFKCGTRSDFKKVAKALVKTNGTIPEFQKNNLDSKYWKSARNFI